MAQIRSQVMRITPEIAAALLKRNDLNRPLSKGRVNRYAQLMRDGKWLLNGESISIAEDGTLLNGQTRLNAIIKAGVGVDILVVVGVDKETYTTFDQGKNRTSGDIFAMAGVPDAKKVASIVARYFGIKNGDSFLADSNNMSRGFGHQSMYKVSKQDLLDIYFEHSDVFGAVARIAHNLNKKYGAILTVAEAGGFYAYLVIDKGYSADQVEPFLTQVFSGNTTFNVIQALHSKIVKSQFAQEKMSALTKTMLFIKAWNCFIAGKDTKRLHWNQETEGKLTLL